MIDREKLMRNAAANFEDSGRPRIKVSAFGEVTKYFDSWLDQSTGVIKAMIEM